MAICFSIAKNLDYIKTASQTLPKIFQSNIYFSKIMYKTSVVCDLISIITTMSK